MNKDIDERSLPSPTEYKGEGWNPIRASHKSRPHASKEASGSDRESHAAGMVNTPIPRLTWRTLVMGIFVSMGGFLFGYDTGQISGILEMENFKERFGEQGPKGYSFSNVRAGLIVALITSPYPKWYQVAIGRWVTGLGVGSLSLLVPLYQGESAPRHIRGALVSTYQLFITLGIFIANCINYGTEARRDPSSWRIPMGITFIWAAILGFGIVFFPDTPRYDYRHNRIDKAKRTMMRLNGVPENHEKLHEEFNEIKRQHEEDQLTKDQPWYAIFSAPTMRYRLLLGITLQAFQQLTGANYFFYYGTFVFRGAGLSNSFITQMILGAVNFLATFIGLYNIEHFGRRKSLIAGALWMFVCFLIFASVGHFVLDREDPSLTPAAGKVMVAFSCLFIVGFACTWGPMVWAIIAELYPSRYRATAMAMATASNWLWNFLLAFFTPFIVGDIDFLYGYVFAGCLLVAAAIVYFGVIEGSGRTLEEIDMMYHLHVKPWKSSKFVIPPSLQRDTPSDSNHENEVPATVPNSQGQAAPNMQAAT
ncbi:monosaccharide transporter [Arthroderma uncinatum]|uniref:monosaccharide transporter n=1 Tax=Arthroderma uncinatum TaxID=74035 RepID=UPI00144AE602|nr:monosaccharide transporter [Arthroderma uncinatum]KAF3480870.1 monosaccharide transporter [Arthroderma uncinatum]